MEAKRVQREEGRQRVAQAQEGSGWQSPNAQGPYRLCLPLCLTSSVFWSSVGEEWVLADLEALLGIQDSEVCCTEQDWVGLGGQITYKI